MKKIGLVGGTGPESTLMYYKELNTRIDQLTNREAMPDLAIESVDFRRAWAYVSAGEKEKLADYLSEKVSCLRSSGCEVISLTAGTMHLVIHEVEKKTGVTLVSIPKAVTEEAANRGFTRVGLLGTIFTMEQDYMKKDLIDAGIEVCIPDKEDRNLVATRIFEELEMGIVKEETLKEFRDLISKMQAQQGIQAVILGCTELPLLLNEKNSPLPVLDSVEIHIRKIIDLAL